MVEFAALIIVCLFCITLIGFIVNGIGRWWDLRQLGVEFEDLLREQNRLQQEDRVFSPEWDEIQRKLWENLRSTERVEARDINPWRPNRQ